MSILSKIKSNEESDFKTKLSEFENKVTDDILKLDIKINNLEKLTQNLQPQTDTQKPSSALETRLTDLEHLISSMEVNLLKSGDHPHIETEKPQNTDKISSLEGNVENILKRINSLELRKSTQNDTIADSFSSKNNSSIQSQNTDQNMLKIVESIRNDLDILKMKSKGLDTSIVKNEVNVNDYLEKINHKVDLKLIDIEEKLDKAFEHVPGKDHYEKNLELRIINMLSEKIEHFAHMLDKKLLDFPTVIENDKKLVRLEGMISKIEYPNFRPLEERLNNLELKMDHLIRSHEKHAKRLPIIVE